MDCLSQPLIGNAQRHGFRYQPRGQRGVLYLLRGNAVARALDHRIAATGEIEQAVGIAHHPVTGPDRHAAMTGRRRSRPEPFRSALRILPIALRHQRAAMDQFAFLPRRGDGAIVPDHQHFGEGNRLAHRSRVRVHQCRVEERGAECLGQAIHREQPRLREDRAQFAHQIQGQRATAIGQAA